MDEDVTDPPTMREVASRFLRESETVVYLRASLEGRVTAWNEAAATRLGRSDEELRDARLEDLVPEDDARRLEEIPDPAHGPVRQRVNFVSSGHRPFTLSCQLLRTDDALHIVGEEIPGERESLQEDLLDLNQELSVLSRERARKSRELAETKEKLEEALEELETSYWHLKKVQEVIPVCMHCERIRGDEASWDNVIEYLRKNSIFVSHGLCPECAERHYDEDVSADQPVDPNGGPSP